MASGPGDALKNGIKDLLKTGLFSDLEIKCADKTFKVHRAILCPQSKYFQKLLAGRFKETTLNATLIELPEDPAIFSVIIHYLYHFVWDDTTRDSIPTPIFAIRVYASADFYDLEPLRKLATRKFKDAIDPYAIPTFVESIKAVEEHVAAEETTFWDILMPLVKKNMGNLLRNGSFKDLLRDNEDVNFRLLAQLGAPAGEEEVDEQEEMMLPFGGGRRLGSW